VGEHVYLHIRPNKSSLRIDSCDKLEKKPCGQFKILERVVLVSYRLALPPIVKTHDIFHIYLLKKYVHDVNHVVDWFVIQVESWGESQPKIQYIIDQS